MVSLRNSFFIVLLFGVALLLPSCFAMAQDAASVTENAQVTTSGAGLSTKVAPGELLPISVKLLNFGGGQRVDVTVTYGIYTNGGKEIYTQSETVAVETTASFVKTIQIPFTVLPGTYIAKTSIQYKDQLVPATTQFPFTVEKKIFGLYTTQFTLYSFITILFSAFFIFLEYALIKRRKVQFVAFDYSKVPAQQRVFFELISDTITQMRWRVGDSAIEIATKIDGLKIDEKSGRVLEITGTPSQIIATLVSRYEKVLGQRVSFSFRK